MSTATDHDPNLTWTPIDRQRQALAQRWRLTTERLVEARHHFRRLSDAEPLDISALRRASRMVYDLELERGALGRAMEESIHEAASHAHRAGATPSGASLRV